ncbi:unnamed protein product [Rotaria sp. Silwood1]|nr:unnamed protein product [Rotaria sp. Silwood1]
MQHNDTSSNNLFTNIERLGTRDLLFYGQFSYDTILTSIQSNNTLPLSVNVQLYIYLIYLHHHNIYQINMMNIFVHVNNEHVNKEQTIIDSSSIIASSDNIPIELVEELYERTKQSATLLYEALLLLRPLSLLLAHISFFFRALINARYSAKVNEWTLLSTTNIAQRKSLCMAIWGFLLMLSRFSARFEESDNRLFLIADRK